MKIFVSVFEPSADEITSQLIKYLRNYCKDIQIFGFGGIRLRELGLIPLFGEHKLDRIIGFEDAVLTVRKHWHYLQSLKWSKTNRPDLALLVDYPGFNLILAAHLKKMGIPVIYYILPQVWAWWGFRAKFLRKYVDLAIGIYPFEPRFFEKYFVKVHYFGHPLLDHYSSIKINKRRIVGEPIIAFFPGSRPFEVTSLMPVFREVIKILKRQNLSKFLLSKVDSIDISLYGNCLGFNVISSPPKQWISNIDIAVASSGTIALELALAGVPTIILYRVKPFTFRFAKIISQVPYISLPNLILGQRVIPELVQYIDPECVSKNILNWIEDPIEYSKTSEKLMRIYSSLGSSGVVSRTAKFIYDWIQKYFAL